MSFFEWVQNLQNFKWEEDDVNRKLDRKMTDAFAAIWAIHKVRCAGGVHWCCLVCTVGGAGLVPL